MGDGTRIKLTDATWNPVTGCTKASDGCKHCYAERMAKRLAGRCGQPPDSPFAVTLHPERLNEPFRWRKPRRIFVCSMGDLFHPDVPDKFIAEVFSRMHCASLHTFQVLTKRPERMAAFLARYGNWGGWITHDGAAPSGAFFGTGIVMGADNRWPLPNVWLGTSCENQAAANERIPYLLRCPAAVRFISAEPLLGPVDLSAWTPFSGECFCQDRPDGCKPRKARDCPAVGIDWLVAGGESGPGARPCDPDWLRGLRDQCQAAGVSYFLKQLGGAVAPAEVTHA